MRTLVLLCLLAGAACAQTVNLGPFTNSGDVGNPAIQGSTQFDPATGQFKITGSGANMWAAEDQFQYVWREMTGNFAITATLEFLGKGEDHRKAGVVLRQSLDTDSTYADFVIHGNGMPGLQWRSNKGEITNTFDMPFDSPGKFTIKLVRNGVGLTVFLAQAGGELKQMARTEVRFQGPILVGLGVCSHKADASDTAVFSDVSVEPIAAAPAGK